VIAYYLTHPQVAIDPDVPVPRWSLSERGRERLLGLSGAAWLPALRRIVCSDEQKAVETGEAIAAATGLTIEIRPNMGENDRSSTGFLLPERFEAAADAFFAAPDESWNGWETARDAQARIVAAATHALDERPGDGPILFVGHGAVGTLLKCHVADRPISRREDQPNGGGNIHAFDLAARRLLCDWTPLEVFQGV